MHQLGQLPAKLYRVRRHIQSWGLGAIALILTVSLSLSCGRTMDHSSAVTDSNIGTRSVEHAMG
ncbi:MAG: hypothetical protein F6K04_26150, partial [Leptolyngbya sp. SIO4C5]|nr:hypothetical protein [Leptolyngbya sp. SIO4C5]